MTAVLGLVLLGAIIFIICVLLIRRSAVEEADAPVTGRHRADVSEAPLDSADVVTVGAHMKTAS